MDARTKFDFGENVVAKRIESFESWIEITGMLPGDISNVQFRLFCS